MNWFLIDITDCVVNDVCEKGDVIGNDMCNLRGIQIRNNKKLKVDVCYLVHYTNGEVKGLFINKVCLRSYDTFTNKDNTVYVMNDYLIIYNMSNIYSKGNT